MKTVAFLILFFACQTAIGQFDTTKAIGDIRAKFNQINKEKDIMLSETETDRVDEDEAQSEYESEAPLHTFDKTTYRLRQNNEIRLVNSTEIYENWHSHIRRELSQDSYYFDNELIFCYITEKEWLTNAEAFDKETLESILSTVDRNSVATIRQTRIYIKDGKTFRVLYKETEAESLDEVETLIQKMPNEDLSEDQFEASTFDLR
jgi:hypothetical protein